MKARILTPWSGSGKEDDPFRPRLADDHKLVRWKDVTAQPAANLQPDPNLFVVEVEATAEALAAIESDSQYLILWSE